MKVMVLFFLFCGTCSAAASELSDAVWLSDPVGAVLVAADAATPTNDTSSVAPKVGPERWVSVDYAQLLWDDAKETATGPLGRR